MYAVTTAPTHQSKPPPAWTQQADAGYHPEHRSTQTEDPSKDDLGTLHRRLARISEGPRHRDEHANADEEELDTNGLTTLSGNQHGGRGQQHESEQHDRFGAPIDESRRLHHDADVDRNPDEDETEQRRGRAQLAECEVSPETAGVWMHLSASPGRSQVGHDVSSEAFQRRRVGRAESQRDVIDAGFREQLKVVDQVVRRPDEARASVGRGPRRRRVAELRVAGARSRGGGHPPAGLSVIWVDPALNENVNGPSMPSRLLISRISPPCRGVVLGRQPQRMPAVAEQRRPAVSPRVVAADPDRDRRGRVDNRVPRWRLPHCSHPLFRGRRARSS